MSAKWSDEDVQMLQGLEIQKRSQATMGALLGRSELSVKAKLATIRGKDYRQTKRGPTPGTKFVASFESPRRRANDDYRHIGLILGAHGCGFPVCGGSR